MDFLGGACDIVTGVVIADRFTVTACRWISVGSIRAVISARRWMIAACPFSKLNPRRFIGGFARLAIACLHADADQRSRLGRSNEPRTRTALVLEAPSNCRAGAQPNSAPLLPSYIDRLFLDLAVALVGAMARKPVDRSA
jgi:hypothetical protein